MTTNTTAMTMGTTTMTTEVVTEPRVVPGRPVTKTRRPHAAAGSRTAALGLSIAATAGLVVAMVSANAQPAIGVPDIAAPVAQLNAVSGSRPSIMLPVAADTVTDPGTIATVFQATPQPIVLQPQRRVVVKSNGSR